MNDSIQELISQLKYIDIAQQYFKIIYLQQELAILSCLLFYTGIRSIAILVISLLVFTAPPEQRFLLPLLDILLSTILLTGFFPLVVLFSSDLRSATVQADRGNISVYCTDTGEDIDQLSHEPASGERQWS